MNTISQALNKNRTESGAAGGDPDSILERNGLYREALRAVGPPKPNRLAFMLASASLGAVLVGLLIAIPLMMSPPNPGPRGSAQSAQPTTAAAAQEAESAADSVPTPAMRERVRLRTTPLLRANVDTDIPPFYADFPEPLPSGYIPGGQPIVLPSMPVPVDTPRPRRPPAKVTDESTDEDAAPEAQPEPPVVSDDPKVFLQLTGLLDDSQNPSALINDQIVQVGDSVQGARVTAINAASVQVEYKDKTYEIRLK